MVLGVCGFFVEMWLVGDLLGFGVCSFCFFVVFVFFLGILLLFLGMGDRGLDKVYFVRGVGCGCGMCVLVCVFFLCFVSCEFWFLECFVVLEKLFFSVVFLFGGFGLEFVWLGVVLVVIGVCVDVSV